MTFYEAALRVLESAGQPLHVLEITERSLKENLLSHVGKTPEQTMLSRLAAMAKRPRDRRVIVTAKDTFALADWQLTEDPEALAQTGVVEPNPEEDLPPYRPEERHPEPRSDNVRSSGRGATDHRRRREEEDRGRRRRFPPISEVAFEILGDAPEGLAPDEIITRARERELASEDLDKSKFLTALLEDNQRRIDAGRRPQFILHTESGKVSLERAGQPSEAPPLELQAAFAAALGIPLEGGRPVLARHEEPRVDAGYQLKFTAAKDAVKDARRTLAQTLRRRLSELDADTFEKCVVKVLHTLHFREVKVAKRSKEGPLLTARRREGSLELRYAVRLVRGGSGVDRRAVQEVRRDLNHYGAQIGLLCSAGELRGDGKSEATGGGALVFLWCGDALAEKFFEAHCGVFVKPLELFEIDERFFDQARADAAESRARREERHKDRERHEPRVAPEAGAQAAEASEGAGPAQDLGGVSAPVEAQGSEATDDAAGDDGEGDEEGDEFLEAATAFVGEGGPQATEPGQPGEQQRRRRRRRRRRGRGGRGGEAGQQGAAGAPGAPGQAAAASQPGGPPSESAPAVSAPEPAPAPPPAPPPAPSGGEGS